MPTDSTLIAEFQTELARLTSFTADIETISKAAVANQTAATANKQTVTQAAEAIQALPQQYRALQELLRADFLGGLDTQRTELAQAASEWAGALAHHLLATTSQLNDFSASLLGDLDDRATALTQQAQQAIHTAGRTAQDQLTTLGSLRRQHEDTLAGQDKLLTSKLTEWGQALAALTQTALQGVEAAGQHVADVAGKWHTETQQHETALAKASEEFNRILFGLTRFRDELDAARFIARLETLTVGLEQLRTQGQTQHTGLLAQLHEVQTVGQQHRSQLTELATTHQQNNDQLRYRIAELQSELTDPISSLRQVLHAMHQQQDTTQAHITTLQAELNSFQRKTQRLQIIVVASVAAVTGLLALTMHHIW